MKVVHRRTVPRMTERAVAKIVLTLSSTPRKAFIITKESPFVYLRLVKEYGIEAVATPVMKNRRIVGYNFKNAS